MIFQDHIIVINLRDHATIYDFLRTSVSVRTTDGKFSVSSSIFASVFSSCNHSIPGGHERHKQIATRATIMVSLMPSLYAFRTTFKAAGLSTSRSRCDAPAAIIEERDMFDVKGSFARRLKIFVRKTGWLMAKARDLWGLAVLSAWFSLKVMGLMFDLRSQLQAKHGQAVANK